MKPSPGLFAAAVSGLGLSPSEVLFVGDDKQRDIIGARNAGLATLWVNEGGRRGGRAASKPDMKIDSLTRLSPLRARAICLAEMKETA